MNGPAVEAGETWAAFPSRCRLAMQVGVVGHRALRGADLPRLNELLHDVLARIASIVGETAAADQGAGIPLFSRDAPVLRCLSALAEGGDRLAAWQAVALGYELAAPLPFHRELYQGDFRTDESRAEFHRLLAKASSVLELNGSREDEAAAYHAAGRVVAEQSDLMIAIWDGLPARGIGGTAQIVAEVEERGIPLIVIDPAAPHAVRHQGLGGAPDWRSALSECLPTRLLPLGSANASDRLVAGGSSPQGFFAERVRPSYWAGVLYRLFERVLLVGSAAAAGMGSSRPETEPVAGDAAARLEARIAPALLAADQLAIRYANLYRASWILRYGLLVPAILGAFVGSFGPGFLQGAGFLLQFASLGGVLVVWWLNQRGRWHQRFIDYRFIAEHLRQARYLALFGGTVSLPRPRPYEGSAPADWAVWYVRASIRSSGLVSAKIDTRYLGEAGQVFGREIDGQIGFYEGRAERFAVIGRRLERLAHWLFIAGFVALLLRAVVFVLTSRPNWRMPFSAASLVIPALAPVFMGMRAQAEYARLGQRYRTMVQLLRGSKQEVEKSTHSLAALERATRGAVSVMLAEVSDWRELIKARKVSFL